MSLLLAVESASGRYCVAAGEAAAGEAGAAAGLGAVGERVAHADARRDEPGFAGLGKLVTAALTDLGAAIGDVAELAVDVGPGNLSSVRAAVAYINGLAFSLGRRTFCANSLELMAAEYLTAGSLPVLCQRKAGGGNAYLGLYQRGEAPWIAFGPLETSVPGLCAQLPALAVAGGPADVVAKLLPEAQVEDSCIEHPSVDVLYRMARDPDRDPGRIVDLAHPLNEGSLVFHEQAVSDYREA
jgi:tRNA threonylcarbamoyladenosine biosynthesis protein TsaB